MRKYLCLALLILCGITANGQTADPKANSRQIQQLDSIASSLFVAEKYEEALVYLLRENNLLESTPDDERYIQALLKMGKCYEQLNIPFKSIEVNKRAISLYGSKNGQENLFVATRSNNIANLYSSLGDNEEALRWVKEALYIARKAKASNSEQINFLNTASKVTFALGKYRDAIEYQRAILEVSEKYLDKHHADYVSMLSTLRSYYNAAGDQENHEKVSKEIFRLKKETEDGLIPQPADLSTPALCRRHNTEALLCSRWILNNYLSTTGMKEAADYIVKFRKNSPDVAVYLGPAEMKWVKRYAGFHVAYIAASVEYALTHREELRFSVDQYKGAMYRLLDYYKENKSFAGEIKSFDKYLSLKEGNPQELDKRLEANFNEFTKAMNSRKNGMFDVEDPVIVNASY